MEVNSDLPIGAWEKDDLRSTYTAARGGGLGAGLPAVSRFRSNTAKLIVKRLMGEPAKTSNDLPAVFIMCPTPTTEAESSNPVRVPMLNNGLSNTNNKIWFVGATLNSGHSINYGNLDDDALFDYVETALSAGDHPALVYDPRTNNWEVRFYPNGLSDPENCEIVDLSSPNVTVGNVISEVETVYQNFLITPSVQGKHEKLWKDAKKHWPVKVAEDRIQTYLRIGLNSAFPTCEIRHETIVGPEGRLDIEIVERNRVDPSIHVQHGLLELKVLRSYGEGGDEYSEPVTRAWVESGVDQANGYRDRKGAKWAALFCFDMRSSDEGCGTCFAHILSKAKSYSVTLKRWYLYNSAPNYRRAKAKVSA